MPIPQYIQNIIAKKDINVKEIKINSTIVDKDIPELVKLLNGNPYITSLNLHSNYIGDVSSKTLCDLKYIKKLDLSFNNFCDKGIKRLVLHVDFTHLDLSGNNLSDKSADFILKNAKQSWIDVSKNFKLSEALLKKVNDKVNGKLHKDESIGGDKSTYFSSQTDSKKRKKDFENEMPAKRAKLISNKENDTVSLLIALQIDIKIEEAVVYYKSGNVKSSLGQYKEAIKDYSKVIRLNPKYALAYTNRGTVKSSLGRYKEAIEDFDETIRLAPNDATAYYNRGLAKENLGWYTEANEDFDEVIRLEPEHTMNIENRKKNTVDLLVSQRFSKSQSIFDKALTIDPQYAKALTGERARKVGASSIASSFFNVGEESLSSQPFSKSAHLFTEFFTVHSTFSQGGKQVTPYLTGRDRQSIACVNTACYRFFRQLPDPAQPLTHLSEAEEEKGDVRDNIIPLLPHFR